MFNTFDVSREVYFMREGFIDGDFKKLGYMFGNALDKYAMKEIDTNPASGTTPPKPKVEVKSIKLALKRDDDTTDSSEAENKHFYCTISTDGQDFNVQVSSWGA